jgi:hypothetical protein
MINGTFDPTRYKWREVTGEEGSPHLIHHDYTILGYDLEAGTLDMVVRWQGDGGHCPIHRHTATTTVIVLEGEQHLWDIEPDGSLGDHRMRKAGDYALTGDESRPHLERGGSEGGLVFFGAHSPTHQLYEIVDDDGNVVTNVTMESILADFEANA